ncbi:hypothetical protein PG990_009602 [Apiospora arundinis]|uniref:Phosphotransferase n=1 Tax=Apiospora arundinis TaxID=335852 RepID=A0ABR2IU51_9PEZI
MELDIEDYLRPLGLDIETAHQLARELCRTFKQLAAESSTQFLATPVSESILRPPKGSEKGRYLAIDIGGTNLRVGFVELLGKEDSTSQTKLGLQNGSTGQHPVRLRRQLEKSWPIFDHLKNEHPDELFSWIGKCIAEVVADGCQSFGLSRDVTLPLGVTFSFPMVQHTLSQAELMSMGKGFAISSKADLGSHLLQGYETSRTPGLPPIRIAAIANDAVSTLVSFVYQSQESQSRRAAMGLICGTGSNATIPLRQNMMHPSKLPKVAVLNGHNPDVQRIAVNTEWSINGTAPALRALGLISKWDEELDAAGEVPGFQPLEYMTAGRYLGELGRLVLIDYLTSCQGYAMEALPTKLQQRFGLTTTFLSHFKPPHPSVLLEKLEAEFPVSEANSGFVWTEDLAIKIYKIAKAIEIRAAGIVAAATIGLLACAGDIGLREEEPLKQEKTEDSSVANGSSAAPPTDLVVGYTGGCIAHFQDYLVDCQGFLEDILQQEFGPKPPVRVTLSPCHDGGITGAGVLCGAAQAQYELTRG